MQESITVNEKLNTECSAGKIKYNYESVCCNFNTVTKPLKGTTKAIKFNVLLPTKSLPNIPSS